MIKKEIELFIDETGEWLEKISLVELPAIESNFLCFSKEETFKFAADEEKRIITGAVMIPQKRMLRIDEKTGEEYYVYFSADTIEQAAHRWLQENMNHQFNLEHSDNTNKVDVVESWIINEQFNDKANSLGFSLPAGTWMMSCKVNDDNLWNEIKEAKYNGFSIEGIFQYNDDVFSKVVDEKQQVIKEAEEFLKSL